MKKSGEISPLFDKWFMRPMAPTGTAVNLSAFQETQPASTSIFLRRNELSKLTYVQEYNAITEVLNKYLEGNAKGSSAATKQAFHAKATFFGVSGDEVVGPEIQKLYGIVDSLEPSPNAQTAIARIDVAGTAANARVDSENVAGQRFTDFFNLLKIDGSWIIVNKIYHIYPVA